MKPTDRLKLPWVIGGHDAAAILGKSRWKSPLRVWAEKLKRVEKDDLSGSPVIQRGKALEKHLLDLYAEATGRTLTTMAAGGKRTLPENEVVAGNVSSAGTLQYVELLRQHPDHPWAVAPLDDVAIDQFGVEYDVDAKSVNVFMRELWGQPAAKSEVVIEGKAVPLPTATQIPMEEMIQLQHYLWVTNRTKASFAIGMVDDRHYRPPVQTRNGVVVFGLTDFLWCDMERHEPFIEAMAERLIEFAGYLERGEKPPWEPTFEDHDWFAKLLGTEAPDKQLDLGADAQDLVHRCHAGMERIEAGERDKKNARVKLMDLMGDAAIGILPSAGTNKKGKPLPGKRVHFKTTTTKPIEFECPKCKTKTATTKGWEGRVLRVPNRERKS